MNDLYLVFTTARADHDELPDHARDRYALAAVLKNLANHLNDLEQDHAAGVLRAACGNWYFK